MRPSAYSSRPLYRACVWSSTVIRKYIYARYASLSTCFWRSVTLTSDFLSWKLMHLPWKKVHTSFSFFLRFLVSSWGPNETDGRGRPVMWPTMMAAHQIKHTAAMIIKELEVLQTSWNLLRWIIRTAGGLNISVCLVALLSLSNGPAQVNIVI